MEKIAKKLPIKPTKVEEDKRVIHFALNDENQCVIVDCYVKDSTSITHPKQVENFKNIVAGNGFSLDKQSIEYIPEDEMIFVDFCDMFEYGEPSYMIGEDLDEISEMLAEFLPQCQEAISKIVAQIMEQQQEQELLPPELDDRCYQ